MGLSHALEDYLEIILLLDRMKKVVRVKDIVEKLGVKAASVVGALKRLEKEELVIYERYGYVDLTAKGMEIAEGVYKRHKSLFEFFTEILGVSASVADRDACEMEHYLSKETFSKLLGFLEFVKECPGEGAGWVKDFRGFQKSGELPGKCEEGNNMSLADIKVGEKVMIKKIKTKSRLKRKFLDMGVIAGSVLEVVKIAPLGDPMDIKIKGYHLSLRKEEAKEILVEKAE